MVCIYNGILFRCKEEETLPFVTTQMDLEDITLNKTSQTEKDKYRPISVRREILKKKKIHRKRDQNCGCQRKEVGGDWVEVVIRYKLLIIK